MTKDQIKVKFKRLIEIAEDLKDEIPEGTDHTKWKFDVISAFREVYGLHSILENEFAKYKFDLRGEDFEGMYPIEIRRMKKAKRKVWYIGDLARAQGLLGSALGELEEKGIGRLDDEKALTCFLGYRFNKLGKWYGSEVQEFLELSGISVITGKEFQPRSMSEKVREKLDVSDFGVAIIEEKKQSAWTRDETRVTCPHNLVQFLC